MRARAYAKVNLGLQVAGPGPDGFHPLRGLFQSVTWADEVVLEPADEDAITVGSGGAPANEGNLAWRALAAVRSVVGEAEPMRMSLTKEIPAGAGLGGGSADAAAVLGLAGRRYGLERETLLRLAGQLGADVPFGFVGGSALVTGKGETVEPVPAISGFALAIVVPPVELDTGRVYRAWDALGEPRGPVVAAAALPPALRDYAPLGNDLYPAAVSLAPTLDEWRGELRHRWDTPVAMTGSGSGLFGFFPTRDEAAEAIEAIPVGARATAAAEPSRRGWEPIPD